jgi:hypothetical protein
MNCPICASMMEELFRTILLKKHDVAYYYCHCCGFLATESPYWLDEAYQSPINASDTGILVRNTGLARLTAVFLFLLYGRSGKFVDYAGGYGILTRMMRDLGFDFYWVDPHCKNLFARGFEYRPGTWKPDLLTCYEAFEHFVDPAAEIEKMVSLSGGILFTTELLPHPIPRPEEWYYYGLDHGQHVSFYSLGALKHLAERFRLNLYTDGRSFHFLTGRKLGKRIFMALLALNRIGFVHAVRLFTGSKIIDDMNRIKEAGGR